MKLMVAGAKGQVAQSLIAAATEYDLELLAVGRPILDLERADTIENALERFAPDIVINAAAYTAVDNAEIEPSLAFKINEQGASALAVASNNRCIPIIHLSTDYVFDGTKTSPYVEGDRTAPLGIYGKTKLDGEAAVVAANPHHIILRTAWVYSPHGRNFVKTILRLSETQDEINVVNDQVGSPTYAPHLADAILTVCNQLRREDSEDRWGVFHAAGSGEASWYDLAKEIFERLSQRGNTHPIVHPIPSSAYPTLACRPANSRLDCNKLERAFAVRLPHWRTGIADCVEKLLQ